MKKIFFIVVLICLIDYSANSQQVNNNPAEGFYTIDYVFTGRVKSPMDSVFALRYRFTKSHLERFGKLIIEDSNRKMILDLNHIRSNDSIEIQNEGQYTYLILRSYDEGDLPLITYGEDKKGARQNLKILNKDGKVLETGQFKQFERNNNNTARQIRTTRR